MRHTFSKEIWGSLAVLGSSVCFYLATVSIRWAKLEVDLSPASFVFFRFFLGFLIVTIVNYFMADSGVEIFQITPRLIILGFGFSFALGITGGLYPAFRASRLQPVKALREDK